MPEQPMVSTSASCTMPVLHIQGQLAGSLLRGAPAHPVRQAGNILDFVCLHPPAFLGDRSRAVVWPFCNSTHSFHFVGVNHDGTPFLILQKIHGIPKIPSFQIINNPLHLIK